VRKNEVEIDALPVLKNARRELFCHGIAKVLTQTQAAKNAGFSARTAESAGSRLAKNVKVQARIAELRELIVKLGDGAVTEAEIEAQGEPASFISTRVRERQYRLTIYQETVDGLRALIDQRAAEYKDISPGGASGLLVRTVRMIGRGKNATRIEEYGSERWPAMYTAFVSIFRFLSRYL
jgi:hypothetical protein